MTLRLLAKAAGDLVAVEAGQTDVDDGDVRELGAEQLEAAAAFLGFQVSRASRLSSIRSTRRGAVFASVQGRGDWAGGGAAQGSEMVNVLPRPDPSLAAETCPP